MLLLYIFFLALVILLLLPTILLSFVRSILSIFGFTFKHNRTHKNDTRKDEASYTSYKTNDTGIKNRHRKKIFDKNEGEYVDFEEIK